MLQRQEIEWHDPSDIKRLEPKKKKADLSMHDGLVLFDDDRIVPTMSGFRDVADIVGKDVKVKVIIGPKQIIISRSMEVDDVMDLFVITQKSPKITSNEGIITIIEE